MIYHLIGDLKVELGDRMPPVEVEDVVGRFLGNLLLGEQELSLVLRATVIQQFQITEKKEKVAVAGCRVRLPESTGLCQSRQISGGHGKAAQGWHLQGVKSGGNFV